MPVGAGGDFGVLLLVDLGVVTTVPGLAEARRGVDGSRTSSRDVKEVRVCSDRTEGRVDVARYADVGADVALAPE
jgi:hypothetical protein